MTTAAITNGATRPRRPQLVHHGLDGTETSSNQLASHGGDKLQSRPLGELGWRRG